MPAASHSGDQHIDAFCYGYCRATKHPERIVATNYYQPAYLIPLVEIVGGHKTSASVIERTATLLRGMHKKAVVIPKELPGLIAGNRIQLAIAREVQALVDEGMATPQQVDDILMFGVSRRMTYAGFFRRLDMMGLDFLSRAFKEWGLPPWKALAEHVERGEFGLKTGKGFYEWPAGAGRRVQSRLKHRAGQVPKRDMADGTV